MLEFAAEHVFPAWHHGQEALLLPEREPVRGDAQTQKLRPHLLFERVKGRKGIRTQFEKDRKANELVPVAHELARHALGVRKALLAGHGRSGIVRRS